MNKGMALVAAVCFGAALGACVRNVVSDARAQSSGPRFEYIVVGGSMSTGGYEEDLNKMGAIGWRYVGSLSSPSANDAMILERSK
jgi:hypothetical protein